VFYRKFLIDVFAILIVNVVKFAENLSGEGQRFIAQTGRPFSSFQLGTAAVFFSAAVLLKVSILMVRRLVLLFPQNRILSQASSVAFLCALPVQVHACGHNLMQLTTTAVLKIKKEMQGKCLSGLNLDFGSEMSC
jgi:hypothetical protein